MFNLQGSEIIIVLLLALVVLGPEKLPDAMRKMGQFYAELKKMSTGFQTEFRAAIDEPLREIRDTANVLRDSADFTKLQQGERDEKPKSADMAATDVPSDTLPTFETPTAAATGEPELAEDSKPAPFSGVSSSAPRPQPTAMPIPPAPFTAMSAPPDEAAEEPVGESDALAGDLAAVEHVDEVAAELAAEVVGDEIDATVDDASEIDDHSGRSQ